MREKPRPAKGILYLTRIYTLREEACLASILEKEASTGETEKERAFDQGTEEETNGEKERGDEVGEENSNSLREFEGSGRKEG